MKWLIKQDVANELQRAHKAGLDAKSDLLAQFVAYESDRHGDDGPHRIMTIADGVATIRIEGTLTPGPSFSAWMYGGGSTRYGEIRESLAAADADDAVRRVEVYIDSPGGRVDGLFETLDVIKAFKKTRTVRAACACSAAYAVAAAFGVKIEATSLAAEFGSIGVAVTYFVWEEDVDIASTEAPEKRPDVTTDEGKAIVRKHLDDLHDLFVESIAEGRGIKAKEVNANFGRGGVLLARDAMAQGLIDKLPKKTRRPRLAAAATAPAPAAAEEHEITALPENERGDIEPQPSAPPPAAEKRKETFMNLEELKTTHPELYSAAVAVGRKEGAEKGAKDAVAKEHDRVQAHLILGEQSGDMKTALEAIKNGDEMTQAITAQYVAAGMNRADQSARQTETDDAAGKVAGAVTEEDTDKDDGDKIADALDKLSGKKVA